MKNNNGASIRRLSNRSLKNNRMRNTFAVLAIILTGILFTAVFSLTGGAMQMSQESTMREVGGRSHAGLKAATKEQYEKIIADPLVEKSCYTIYIGIADNIIKRQAEIRYTPDGDSLDDMFITLTEGHMPVGQNEIIVDTFILDELKLAHRLGEKIPLTFTFMGETIEEEFVVCGYYQGDYIAHASELFVSESYWSGLKGSLTDEDFINWGMEHPEYNKTGLRAVNLYFDNASHLEEKVRTVIRNAGYEPETEIDYGVNWAYMSSRVESVDPFTLIILISAILIILMTGYLIIYNIFQISVTSDIRFYGLLKTIGTTKKQIRRLIKRQAAILSAIGIPIGLILGYGIAKAALPFVFSFLDYSDMDVSLQFNPWILVFSAVFSILTVFLSCHKPGKLAGSVSPIEALKYTQTDGRKKKKLKKKKRNSRFSPVSMAFANLGRNRRTTTVVIATISLSVILLSFIMTAVGSFRLDQFLEKRIAGDFLLGNVNVTAASPKSGDYSIDPDFLALADMQEGIEDRAEMWVSLGSSLQINDKALAQYKKLDAEGKLRRARYLDEALDKILRGEKSMDGILYGYSEELLGHLQVLDGTFDIDKFLSGDYILLSRFMGNDSLTEKEHVYCPGDKVTMERFSEGSTFHEIMNEAGETIGIEYENLMEKEYEVMAIVEIPSSMNLHRYTANGCDMILPLAELTGNGSYDYERFAVSYQVGADYRQAFETAVKEYTENVNTQMGYASKATLQAEFENMTLAIATMGITLAAVIALIGILNFINAIITEIISRRREFAMLQSIGMTNAQLQKLLAFEGIGYIGISGIISFVLGSLLSWMILNALNNVILFFEYHFQILPFLIMIPLLLLVAVLAPLLAYRRMKRKSIVERLRESE